MSSSFDSSQEAVTDAKFQQEKVKNPKMLTESVQNEGKEAAGDLFSSDATTSNQRGSLSTALPYSADASTASTLMLSCSSESGVPPRATSTPIKECGNLAFGDLSTIPSHSEKSNANLDDTCFSVDEMPNYDGE
ncbi:unnamed protein product [Cylicocyclus nassatus]|uniref:Uncharacterized protein n=1 Tax=Cylicocyclus nassatus TaxID=53992 RepID=A0AA36HH90_CYLNA|nr:unnamed protein product [Cylicocyclus nassatus]